MEEAGYLLCGLQVYVHAHKRFNKETSKVRKGHDGGGQLTVVKGALIESS